MEDFFVKLGRALGTRARKGRWLWTSLTGREAEAIEAEYQAGCDLARAFDRGVSLDADPRSREIVARTSGRLSRQLTNKQRRWRVAPIQADEPGAFAMPGGFIYLTRPLLELCSFDEDEIACVIGHEMGHVVRGHAIDRIHSQLVTNAAARAVRLPSGLLTQWILDTGISLLHSAYSRGQEFDADEFGARLAAACAYDPRAAIRAFERLQKLEGDGEPPLARYFSSHPPLAERIERLQALIRVRASQ